MSEKAVTARRLLNHQSVGVLSTQSVDVAGYPFGSIAPYMLNYESEPVILISDLAQHTRNIKQDNKVSLTVFDRYADDPPASARLTWIGEAELVHSAEPELRQRYLRYFPAAESYFQTHDFAFYVIHLRRARFIGGFGQIYWVESADMLLENPFRQTEPGIVQHMNADHQRALRYYCQALRGLEVQTVALTGIDSEGFDLLADGRKVRIDFDAPLFTLEEARATLARLARA
jgi:putative heme iron utilization protein